MQLKRFRIARAAAPSVEVLGWLLVERTSRFRNSACNHWDTHISGLLWDGGVAVPSWAVWRGRVWSSGSKQCFRTETVRRTAHRRVRSLAMALWIAAPRPSVIRCHSLLRMRLSLMSILDAHTLDTLLCVFLLLRRLVDSNQSMAPFRLGSHSDCRVQCPPWVSGRPASAERAGRPGDGFSERGARQCATARRAAGGMCVAPKEPPGERVRRRASLGGRRAHVRAMAWWSGA